MTSVASLTPAQLDRACGAVLGTAIGDALGAGYEFGSAALGPEGPRMIGGGLGGFAPGEWTDDTTMAWAILDVAARGGDLREPQALTAIARKFRRWYESVPADIGIHTRRIVRAAGADPTGAAMLAQSRQIHESSGHTGGNGSLMRTAPVALRYLADPVALADAARTVGALTHFDEQAQDACALWSLAIRHAIVHGEFDLRQGLAYLSAEGAAFWTARIDEAQAGSPQQFTPNGWVVTALQAAWSAIVHSDGFTEGLATAIGIGDDTDTVAAIAGGLLGAVHGASAVPQEWRAISHGYPGLTGEDLVELARQAVVD